MPSALDHVRLVLTAADTGATLPPITVRWLADGLRATMDRRRVRLEAALGITARGGVGGMSQRQRRDTRSSLLRAMRERFYPGTTPREAARAILNLHDRRVRQSGDPAAPIEDLMDAVLATGLPVPGEKQLARILGT